MENVLDYIVLFIVIGLSLIGSMAKKKKVQTNKSESVPPKHSDPWKEFETESGETPTRTPLMPTPPVYGQSQTDTNVTTIVGLQPTESSVPSPFTVSSIKDNSEQSEALYEDNSQLTWLDRHVGNFDPETAIVYSEILRPKFED